MFQSIILKAYIIASGILLVASSYSYSAEFFSDKGSFWLNGTASFKSVGIENKDDRLNSIQIMPALFFFPTKYLMIGPRFLWQGNNLDDNSLNVIGLGVGIGFAYGKNMPVIPYLSTGFQFDISNTSFDGYDDTTTGFTIPISAGIIIPITEHFSMNVEPVFFLQNHDGTMMNTFSIALGFGGMLF